MHGKRSVHMSFYTVQVKQEKQDDPLPQPSPAKAVPRKRVVSVKAENSKAKRLRVSQAGLKTGIPASYQITEGASAATSSSRAIANSSLILNSEQSIVEQVLGLFKEQLRLRIGFSNQPYVTAVHPDGTSVELEHHLKVTDLNKAVIMFKVSDIGTKVIPVQLSYAINEKELQSVNSIHLLVPGSLDQQTLALGLLEKLQRPASSPPDPHLQMSVRVGLVTRPVSSEEKCLGVTALEIRDQRRAFGWFPIKVVANCATGPVETYILGHHAFKGVDLASQILEQPRTVGEPWVTDFEMVLGGVPLELETPLLGITMKIGQQLTITASGFHPLWVCSGSTWWPLLMRSPTAALSEFNIHYLITSTFQRPRMQIVQQDVPSGPKAGQSYVDLPPNSQSVLLYTGSYHARYFVDQPDAHLFNQALYSPIPHPQTKAPWLTRENFHPGLALTLQRPELVSITDPETGQVKEVLNLNPAQWWEAES